MWGRRRAEVGSSLGWAEERKGKAALIVALDLCNQPGK